MGKRFQFKLSGLLKLREFHEEKMKVELGQLISDEQKIIERISEIDRELTLGYQMQTEALGSKSKGRDTYFYPYYFQGKRADRERCENILFSLRKKIQQKREELAKAMGDVKVIENLKEKQLKDFKIEEEKKHYRDIEENIIMGFGKKEKEL